MRGAINPAWADLRVHPNVMNREVAGAGNVRRRIDAYQNAMRKVIEP